MAGLLDFLDSGDAQLGLGLLAAASARSDGAGFGQRLLEGVGHAQSWKQQKKKDEYAQTLLEAQKFEMEQKRLEAQQRQSAFERDAKIQAGMGQFFKPGQQALSPLAGDPSIGIMPSAGRAAVAPSFDANGASSFLAQNGDYKGAFDLMDKFKPKAADYKVVDGTLVQIGDSGVKPVFTAPQKPAALPSAVQEYQYAREQGYKGSFEQWQNTANAAKAPRMSVDLRDPTAVAGAAMKLQNDYRAATKPSYARAQAYEAMTEAAKNPSAKGDLTLVYSFVKALDPESVVREGEISLLNANRSVPDHIKGYAQRLATGQSLLPKEREDLLKQAQTLTQTDFKRSRNDIKAYRENASRLGLDPELYTPDPYATFKPARAVVRTGVMGGKKVVQYDDGTTEYAN